MSEQTPPPASSLAKTLAGINVLFLGLGVFCLGGAALFLAFMVLAALVRLELTIMFLPAFFLLILLIFIKWLAEEFLLNMSVARGRPSADARFPSAAAPIVLLLLFAGAYGVTVKLRDAFKPSEAQATFGNLGAVRSALSIYYGDLEGLYPEDTAALTKDAKYITEIPKAKTMHHPHTADIVFYPGEAALDTGAWGYVNDPADANYGRLFVDCTHTDMKGKVWTSY